MHRRASRQDVVSRKIKPAAQDIFFAGIRFGSEALPEENLVKRQAREYTDLIRHDGIQHSGFICVSVQTPKKVL
jgi:hypothetical protein